MLLLLLSHVSFSVVSLVVFKIMPRTPFSVRRVQPSALRLRMELELRFNDSSTRSSICLHLEMSNDLKLEH